MKTLVLVILSVLSLSTFANDFERGFNAGLKSCSEDNYYICSADYPGARLRIRSLNRGVAIKKLYDYCLGPSGTNYRSECATIVNQDLIVCKKL